MGSRAPDAPDAWPPPLAAIRQEPECVRAFVGDTVALVIPPPMSVSSAFFSSAPASSA